MYADSRADRNTAGPISSGGTGNFFSGNFFGTNFALRLGVAYRLGQNPDKAAVGPVPAQP